MGKGTGAANCTHPAPRSGGARPNATTLDTNAVAPADLLALAASFQAARPRIGRNRRALSRLRDPEVARGLCVSVARAFARHCADAEVTAGATGWLSPRSLGLGTDEARNHSVCLVSLDGRSWWTVDWSAAQYGSAEFPRIRVAAAGLTLPGV